MWTRNAGKKNELTVVAVSVDVDLAVELALDEDFDAEELVEEEVLELGVVEEEVELEVCRPGDMR